MNKKLNKKLKMTDIVSVVGLRKTDYEFYRTEDKEKRMRFIRDATLVVKTRYDGVLVYKVKKGFTSDGGSIPRWARWLISKWSPRELLFCYLIHDINFGCQTLTFERSNSIFDGMLNKAKKKADLNRFQIKAVIFAVNTKVARRHYNDEDSWDKANRKLVNFEWKPR